MTTPWAEIKRRRPLSKQGRREYQLARLGIDIADQVRALRATRRISQGKLAERIGASQLTVVRLESGEKVPSPRPGHSVWAMTDAPFAAT
ncbi:MAG: helix-turn-helix transcriptional regulator [Chloroflexi bacterium]|nr:MAG: helix-turn-helix transcriptional regulator [Chloroflexota bacterium]